MQKHSTITLIDTVRIRRCQAKHEAHCWCLANHGTRWQSDASSHRWSSNY